MTGWARLQDGNQRFVAGASAADEGRGPARRKAVVAGQTPYALVLGCADSRVPPEIVFDAGLGDLFVVRTAGHVLDDAVLGSVEYGVGVLGIGTLVVLGHEGCGAVAAATALVAGGEPPAGYVRGLAERIAAHVPAVGAGTVVEVVAHHAAETVEQLRALSEVVREAEFHGHLRCRAAVYELDSGCVRAVGTRAPGTPVPDAVPGARAVPALRSH